MGFGLLSSSRGLELRGLNPHPGRTLTSSRESRAPSLARRVFATDTTRMPRLDSSARERLVLLSGRTPGGIRFAKPKLVPPSWRKRGVLE